MPDNSRLRRRRWVIFGALSLTYILVYFYRVSLAVVARDISRELHLTPQQLGPLAIVLYLFARDYSELG